MGPCVHCVLCDLFVFHVQVIWLFPNAQVIWLFPTSKWFDCFPSPFLTNKFFAHTHTCFLFSRLGEDFKVVLFVLNQFLICMRVMILNLPIVINLCLLCKCSVTLINFAYSFRIISRWWSVVVWMMCVFVSLFSLPCVSLTCHVFKLSKTPPFDEMFSMSPSFYVCCVSLIWCYGRWLTCRLSWQIQKQPWRQVVIDFV